jgi:hypothetical protein
MSIDEYTKTSLQKETKKIKAITNNLNAKQELEKMLYDINFRALVYQESWQLGQYPPKELEIPFLDYGNDPYGYLVPDYLSPYVTSISDFTGYDHLSVLMGIIDIIAIATNGKLTAQVNSNWNGQLSLYSFFIGESGTFKTPFFSMLRNPLDQCVDELNEKYKQEIVPLKDLASFQHKSYTKLKNKLLTGVINELYK